MSVVVCRGNKQDNSYNNIIIKCNQQQPFFLCSLEDSSPNVMPSGSDGGWSMLSSFSKICR